MDLFKCLADGVSVSFFMAIVDFIPVIFFMFAQGAIIKLAYLRMKPIYFAVLTGGVFLGFFAGLAKCVWKLIYAFGYDFVPLNTSFAIYQTVGFAMIAFGAVALLLSEKSKAVVEKGKTKLALIAAPVFFIPLVVILEKPSFLWYIFMALFTVIYLVSFSILAFRKKRYWLGIFYYISMILMFMMVGLRSQFESGGSFEQMNWIAQLVNVITQCMVILPTHLLLKDYPRKKIQIIG